MTTNTCVSQSVKFKSGRRQVRRIVPRGLVLLLLLVAAALFPHASHAQVINWVHRTDGPGDGPCGDDTGKGIAIGPDGNIYLTGQANVNTPRCSDVFVQSLTPAGAERWTYLFDGGAFDFGYAIAVGADGNSYIAAESSTGSAGPLFTIVSVDPNGHFRWAYQYGLPGTLNAAFDVKVAANGTIYACGIGTLTPVSGTESMFVVALNPERLLLGGGLLSNSPRMRRTVGEALEQNLSKAARAAVQIGTPALEEDAAVVGAALIAREALSR